MSRSPVPVSVPSRRPVPYLGGLLPYPGRTRLLGGPLPSPGRVRLAGVRYLGPNWYAAVMGTAMVAGAGAALRLPVPGLPTALAAVWALSLLMLAALVAARAMHWARHRDRALAQLRDPSTAPFHGCAAMAPLAVGGAALTAGREWIGLLAAVILDAVLYTAGTLLGLAVAVAVPYLMVVARRPAAASPVWLLAVVPPMVSAALGPPLVAHLPADPWQRALLTACHGMFGLSLLATLALLPLVVGRLLADGPPPAALTPVLFLVLGPLGQSVTAAGAFADAVPGVPYAPVLAVLYGVPVLGFALLWLALAGALVVRARRHGMGFSMTWWAFTFPVGTCVTGAAGLARHTGIGALHWLAVALYVFLVAAWCTVAVRTGHGLATGSLLRPPPGEPRPARPPRAEAGRPYRTPVAGAATAGRG
ncbi:TDT family transporter [Streptomyces lichenis]|uniref:TDT family transporter n=1 Tax=Streptomyces lichenis TaxID=2306967 RepID=UPI0035590621